MTNMAALRKRREHVDLRSSVRLFLFFCISE